MTGRFGRATDVLRQPPANFRFGSMPACALFKKSEILWDAPPPSQPGGLPSQLKVALSIDRQDARAEPDGLVNPLRIH
jgi:hypothetical protein